MVDLDLCGCCGCLYVHFGFVVCGLGFGLGSGFWAVVLVWGFGFWVVGFGLGFWVVVFLGVSMAILGLELW